MSHKTLSRTNTQSTLLGDVRAEVDQQMLDQAFVETPDYKTLLESRSSKIIVGRRGTGKSALVYRLFRHWNEDKNSIVLKIAAKEDQVIGTRPLLAVFGEKFSHVRTGAKLIWQYALVLELLEHLSKKYIAAKALNSIEIVQGHLKRWRASGPDFFTRFRITFKTLLSSGLGAEEIIGGLAQKLQLRELEAALSEGLAESNTKCTVLIDRLDEGYQHDTVGIAFVDGVIYAISELDAHIDDFKALVFLRDNIFRAISIRDPDFSRNIEGQTLRLHWDIYQLFNMVTNRLRAAFELKAESNQRAWDRCTATDLQGQEGFKKCLQLTLYRPRDILILLNDAFYNAYRQNRTAIVLSDIDATAKSISANRLSDLHKEYEMIFPGLSNLTSLFFGRSPELNVDEAMNSIKTVLTRDNYSPEIQQDFAIFRRPEDQLRNLYSVGFIGVQDRGLNSFTYCHDGKQPDREFSQTDKILIHPCYWLALNLTKNSLKPDEAEEINDEYEIHILSQTPELRAHKLGQMISGLEKIPLGNDGAILFEDWCVEAVRVAFAGKLRNVELHPNKTATQRRDIVGTNLSSTGAWKRIYDDYKSRQVIFEVKNYAKIGIEEYRQMLSYLSGEYGNLGFIITRDDSHNLVKGADLDHFLEMHNRHDKTIVKLTGRYLCTLLSKLRSPQKHDEPDHLINKLLDTYSRQYVSGQAELARKRN